MKRPLAYITAAWSGDDCENAELAAKYCRTVYKAGFSPICPTLYLPLILKRAKAMNSYKYQYETYLANTTKQIIINQNQPSGQLKDDIWLEIIS